MPAERPAIGTQSQRAASDTVQSILDAPMPCDADQDGSSVALASHPSPSSSKLMRVHVKGEWCERYNNNCAM